MQRLTKRAVDGLEPKRKYYIVWDAAVPGFGVRVWPSGRKVYVLQYRDPAGTSQRIVIGEHGSFTAEDARAEAIQQRGRVVAARRDPNVLDPARERDRAKTQSQAAHGAPTVAECADEFLAQAEAKLKPSTVYEYRRLLGVTEIRRGRAKGKERIGELRKAVGRFKVAEVTKAQVSKLHLGMKDRPYMANRALSTLSALFTYAKDQGYRDGIENPCAGIREFKEHKRERLLTDAEYAALGVALRQAETVGLPVLRNRRRATARTAKHRAKDFGELKPANPIGIAAIRFLLLTGWRENEALMLKWSSISFARNAATLPDTKTGRSERELGAPAVLLLNELEAMRRKNNPYVFYGAKDGAHYRDVGRLWESVRAMARLKDVRLHDLRHGFASVGLASGLTLPVIGALLGHSDVTTTVRYAHLADTARKRAADLTATAIASALAGSTVGSASVASGMRAIKKGRRLPDGS